MTNVLTATAIALAVSLSTIAATTSAGAQTYASTNPEYPGYPDWANEAFRPKGKR